jgi:uncharacterized protein YbjT (DUF2867 family)
MKVLIIGATGMLARPVVQAMSNAGFSLRLFSRKIKHSDFQGEHEIVQGDLFTDQELDKAVNGCDAIHINLSGMYESESTRKIVEVAKSHNIQLISMITGCTVAEENRWFQIIDQKFLAEQSVIKSGIPYLIFRPTWFFESLGLMVRKEKAMMIGNQPIAYHWMAASDYAEMVVKAYLLKEIRNKVYYLFGPEPYKMKDLLSRYCEVRFPEIKKVNTIPIWFLRFIAFISGNKELKLAVSLFAYFEKTGEMGDPAETNRLLGKPQTTFDEWLKRFE